MLWMWWAIDARTGEISYTVDDAYIHGTIAKNLALHGTFGINPGEFAGASSSLLWTFLLATAFLATGIHAWLPALLATLFGVLAIERSNLLLKRIGIGPWLRLVMVLMAMAYAPVLPIVSTGMEHTFHAWSVMGLFALLVREAAGKSANPWVILIWGTLAAGGRYESLFLLPPLLIRLALRKKWIHVAALTAGMFLPVVAFAACSLAHGGYALPNSLMLKGNVSGAFHIRIFDVLLGNNHLMVLATLLLIATLALFLTGRKPSVSWAWLPASALGTLLIHLQLASLGWFWRYEGYLVMLGMIALAPALVPLQVWLRRLPRPLESAIWILLIADTYPLFQRFRRSAGEIVQAAGNIRDQQLQMARVIRHLGPGARVAANDLGAVSFFSEARVLDLWGLGDNVIARAKREGRETAEYLRERMEEKKTDFVVCYPSWFKPSVDLPESLIAVQMWQLGGNLVCASDTVAFYATSPEAAARLAAALRAYQAEVGTGPARSTNLMGPLMWK